MARRTTKKPNPATENKDAQQPPENKDDSPVQDDDQQPDESQQDEDQQQPQNDEQLDEDSLLAEYVETKAMLDKLLKAEQRQYVGSIGRRQLHQIADSIRKQLAAEPEAEDTDDE